MELKTIREAVKQPIYTQSRVRNVLKRYMDFASHESKWNSKTNTYDWIEHKLDTSKDTKCVVAYRRNNLGCVFIIKGNKYFAFKSITDSYTFRIDNSEAIKLINDKTNEVWLKPSHLQKIEAIEMVNKLK